MVRIHSRKASPCCATSRARKVMTAVLSFFVGSLFLLIFFSHRLIATQQNNRTLVKAPINELERDCPKPVYETVNELGAAGKICITTLTDTRKGDWWQRMIKWRYFDDLLEMTWPNKLNYAMKHGYQLFDESQNINNKRAPAWSKIIAVKRLLQEENCNWVFWLDADTVIMNSNKRVEEFLPKKESGIDLVVTHEKGKSFNAGAFLLRNSEWSISFLNDWWNSTDYIKIKGQADAGDNRALKNLLQSMNTIEYEEKIADPPRCQFNSVAKFFTPAEAARMTPQAIKDNKRLYLHVENYHKGDFIAHVAGINNKRTTTQMLLEDAQ